MKENDIIIKSYIPMVDFISNLYGENCEVILHDLRNLEHSIVCIKNSHVTGRGSSSTLTDFALDVVYNKEKYKNMTHVSNYTSTGKNGNSLRSSSYFIRGSDNELIGMICVNIDTSIYRAFKSFFEQQIGNSDINEPKEKFTDNIFELVVQKIEDIFADHAISPTRMTIEEKKEIVRLMNQKGIFLLKGSVTIVADRLNVSEQTVYRYIKEWEMSANS